MDQSNRAVNDNGVKKEISGRKIFVAVFLMAIVVAFQFLYIRGIGFGDAREWRMTETGEGVDYDFNTSASFHSYNSRNYFFCTRDGMKYESSGGVTRWQFFYNISKPVMKASHDKVAVGEFRGRQIYVFDSNGLLYEVPFEDPVLFFSVNESGYLSVILQLDQGYAVNVYNQRNNFKPLYSNVIRDRLIHPFGVDVSADGRFTVIAMMDMNVRMTLRVLFYFTNQWDSPTVDGLIASEHFNGQISIPPAVKFMSDNRVLIFSDERIVCFRLGTQTMCDELWQIPLHNKIDALAFYGGSRFAFAAGEPFLNDENALEAGLLQIYSVSGEKTGEYALARRATHLSMGWDAALVGADRNFFAISASGNRLWEYVSLQDTSQFIFLDNTDTVLMAGATSASVLKRVRVRLQTAEDGIDELR